MAALLTNNLIALQYLMTDELYAIEEPEELNIAETVKIAEIPVAEPVAFNYLGENNRYMLLIVKNAQNDFLSASHLEMLVKILKGKQMELRDVAILNLHTYHDVSYEKLKDFFAFKSLVLFGLNPQEIGLSELTGNEITMIKETKVLATFSFAEMQDDDNKKRAFWAEMKKL